MSELRAIVAAVIVALVALVVAGTCAYFWHASRVELAVERDRSAGLEAQVEAQRSGADDRCSARLELQARQHRLQIGAERSKLRVCLEADRTAERLEADPAGLIKTYRELLGYDEPSSP